MILETQVDALDITVISGGGDEVGQWALDNGFLLTPDAPEVLDYYAERSPVFMAAKFDASRAEDLGQGAGDSTPIMARSQPTTPGCPSDPRASGSMAPNGRGRRVPADRREAEAAGRRHRADARARRAGGRRLLDDLRSDENMEWIPESMWFSYLSVDAPAGELDYDLAVAAGPGTPSLVDAGVPGPTPCPCCRGRGRRPGRSPSGGGRGGRARRRLVAAAPGRRDVVRWAGGPGGRRPVDVGPRSTGRGDRRTPAAGAGRRRPARAADPGWRWAATPRSWPSRSAGAGSQCRGPAARPPAGGARAGGRDGRVDIEQSVFATSSCGSRGQPGAVRGGQRRSDRPELIVGPPEVHARHEWGNEAQHPSIPGEVSVGPRTGVTTTGSTSPARSSSPATSPATTSTACTASSKSCRPRSGGNHGVVADAPLPPADPWKTTPPSHLGPSGGLPWAVMASEGKPAGTPEDACCRGRPPTRASAAGWAVPPVAGRRAGPGVRRLR